LGAEAVSKGKNKGYQAQGPLQAVLVLAEIEIIFFPVAAVFWI